MAHRNLSDSAVGHATMLEQFHPTEAVKLTALEEQHGFVGDGRRPRRPVGARARAA